MTTTQTTHTPFSLVLDECRDAQGAYTLRLADGTANGDTKACPIATVYQDHNAAHIVHCVNTYPALLAALRECITEEGAYCLNHDSKALLRGRLASITLLAKQAIALAEGK